MAASDASPDFTKITFAIVALFMISLIWAAFSVQRSNILLNDRLRENVQWAGWQVPFELGRLENAVMRYGADMTEANRRSAGLRLDVAASRLQILFSGTIAEEIARFGLSDMARSLRDGFDPIDRDLQRFLGSGDGVVDMPDTAMHDLEALISFSQRFAAQIQTAEMQRIASLVDSKSARLEEFYITLVGLLLSGVLFAAVTLTSARRMRRFSRDAVAARRQAGLSEQILIEAIEALPDAFALFDEQDRLALFNSRYREFYQTSADLMRVGASFEEIIRHGVERGQYVDAVADPETWIAARLEEHRRADGHVEQHLDDGRFLRVTELRTSAGYTVGIRTDITDIRRAQLRAEHSEQRFRLAAQMTSDGLWVLVPATGELWLSDPFREMFALGEGPASLETWQSRIDPESWRLTSERLSACIEGRIERFEVQQILRADDGEPRFISCRGVREAGEDGSTLRIVGAIVDETERRLFERKIDDARLAAERIAEARDSFMTMISHEIRTPMNGVIGALEAIADEKLSADARRYTTIALESSQSLRAVVDDVLDAAKIDAGEFALRMTDVSPGRLVVQVARLMAMRASQLGLDLAVFVDPRVPRSIVGDELRLRQVLVNLLGNAIKFTPRGGVALRLERIDGGGPSCKLRFAVIDTGIGIAADKLDRLFTPFRQIDEGYRREFGGTGLGLSISQSIVEALGSRITCSSRPGEGSTFAFEIVCSTMRDDAPIYASDTLHDWAIDLVSGSTTIMDTLGDQLEALGARLRRQNEPCDAGVSARSDLMLVERSSGDPSSAVQPSALRELAPAPQVVFLHEDGLGPPYDPQALISRLTGKPVDESFNQPEHDRSAAFAGLRALIAEDSAINRQLAERMMSRLGFEITSASNGAEAVEAARAGRFDVILMDVSMPVMNGIEAARQIRTFCQTPVIAVTAHAFASASREIREAGMSYHLIKPFRRSDLLRALEIAFEKAPPAAPRVPERSHDCLMEPSILAQLTADVGAQTAFELLNSYRAEMQPRVEAVIAAIEAGDWAAAEREAHTLKGSSRTFGAVALADVAHEIEIGARQGDAAPIRDLRGPLDDLARQTGTAIDAMLAARHDRGIGQARGTMTEDQDA